LEHKLEADRALLAEHEAAGYIRLTRETLHKGDRVFWAAAWGDGIGGAIVTRTNPKTVTLDRRGYPRTLEYEEIKTVECPHEGTEVTVTAPKRSAASRRPAPAIVVPTLPERPVPLVVDASTEFFPTPPAVVARMIAAAGLSIDLDVLEPSAGLGAIALKAVPLVSAVDCIERSGQLAERLRAVMPAYCDVRCADFLEIEPNPILTYDRVLMNPPFSGEQDVRHVMHALKFVRPGGRLVAVMSAGAEFHQSKAAVAFRALVASSGGRIERLPEDAFAAAGISIRTVMAVIPVPNQEEASDAGQ
jgi:predicted RNA methylase